MARSDDFDLIIVSLGVQAFDGLRLCSNLRSVPEARHTPLLAVVNGGETRKLSTWA
jgi:two-component system cell cycle response regulator